VFQHRCALDFRVAEDLAISDVARVFGLRTSAIRYYEQIGILPPPMRKNGQRHYDNSAFFRLAVMQRARETGVHPGGNTRTLFRVLARDASTETMAQALPTKNRGTPGRDEAA
jgi:DNA-binding transcriptional MerR regulator